jgi:hypothetical protein
VFVIVRSNAGQSSGRARGRDHQTHFGQAEFALGTAQLQINKFAQTRNVFFAGRVGLEKLLLQAHGAERKADHLLDARVFRVRDLAAAAAEIDHQAAAARAGFMRDDAEMDEAALFKAGDDFNSPSGGGFDPGTEGLRVARVARRAGRDDTYAVDNMLLHGLVEALEGLDGVGHGLRRDDAGLKDTFAEARDLAVLVQCFEMVLLDTGDGQAAGVRTDVNRSKGRHLCSGSFPILARRREIRQHPQDYMARFSQAGLQPASC